MMKNRKILILLFVVLFCVPAAAQAYEVRSGFVNVAEGEIVEGNLYAAGSNVTVDGSVTGDVICAGQSVRINGIVDGDVICAGQSIDVAGYVGGSVRAAGSNVGIRGSVERNLTAFAANVDIDKEAVVGWDALIGAATARLSGEIGRSVIGAGASFFLEGIIGGDAVFYLDNKKSYDKSFKQSPLTVGDSAIVGGKLEYTSRTDASISSQAQIEGEITRKEPKMAKRDGARSSGFFGIFLIALLSAMVLGYVIAGVWKKQVLEITDAMQERFWPILGWGAVWMTVIPLIAVMLAITIIGFRLTLVAMWSWLIILMISKVLVAILVGRLLLEKIWTAKKDSLPWAVTLGIILSWIIFCIPVIGWLLSLAAVWYGGGAILLYLKKNYDMNRAETK